MKTIVMYVTARVVVECEDLSIDADEIFNDMDYDFSTDYSGTRVVDTELVEFEVSGD